MIRGFHFATMIPPKLLLVTANYPKQSERSIGEQGGEYFRRLAGSCDISIGNLGVRLASKSLASADEVQTGRDAI
jgi:hypothetical protein